MIVLIECIVGLPGTGKTLMATHWVITTERKYDIVAANYEIKLPSGRSVYRLDDWQDIYRVSHRAYERKQRVLMVVDEANIWFMSRHWRKIPPAMLYLWSQTRKFSIDLIYTTQSFRRVDTVLREITNYVYRVRMHPVLPTGLRRVVSFPVYLGLLPFKGKREAKRIRWQLVREMRFGWLCRIDKFTPLDLRPDGWTPRYLPLRSWYEWVGDTTIEAYDTTARVFLPSSLDDLSTSRHEKEEEKAAGGRPVGGDQDLIVAEILRHYPSVNTFLQEIGVDKRVFTRFRNGNVRMETADKIIKLAKKKGVDVEEAFYGKSSGDTELL